MDVRLIAIVLLLCAFSVRAQQHIGVASDIMGASPAMALDQLESSWANPAKGRYAQARARFNTYVSLSSSFTLGFQRRWDYLLSFSQETAQFYSRLESNQIEDGVYSLDFAVNAAQGDALYLQYLIPLSFNSSIEITGYVIQGNRIQEGRLTGQGQVQGSQLSYDWQLDYAYDENQLFDTPRQHVSAWGHSFDLAYSTRLNEQQRLAVSVEDLFYVLYWDAVPQDRGCLSRPMSSSCSVYSAEGAHTQRLPVFAKASWSYSGAVHTAWVGLESWQRYNGLRLGWKAYGAGVDFDVLNEKLNIGYESSRLKVKWGFDDIDPSNAKHWQLNLDMNWPIL